MDETQDDTNELDVADGRLEQAMIEQPCLPFEHEGAAMIENPRDSNEILMFSYTDLKTLYIYNTKNQTYRNIDTKESRFDNPNFQKTQMKIMKLMIDTSKANSIIAIGFGYFCSSFVDSFSISHFELFATFDTKEYKWKWIDIHGCTAHNVSNKFHGRLMATICFKNFLIISGGSGDFESLGKISIFDLNSLVESAKVSLMY